MYFIFNVRYKTGRDYRVPFEFLSAGERNKTYGIRPKSKTGIRPKEKLIFQEQDLRI